jgi:tetratricopeptide (TPR) repeat protein
MLYQYPGYAYWEKGRKQADNRSWKQAIELYEDALKRLPQKGELQFHLGSALVLSGDYSKGIYQLGQSLKMFNDRNIYLSLSYGYLKLKEFGNAETYAKQALSLFPDQLAPHLLLGEIYFYMGNIDKSKESLLKCIRRKTHIQSQDTEQICRDARQLWHQFYHNDKV